MVSDQDEEGKKQNNEIEADQVPFMVQTMAKVPRSKEADLMRIELATGGDPFWSLSPF